VNGTRARVFEYGVTLDRAWSARSERGGSVLADEGEEWTPEHLLLASLARCTLTSFRYHARRAGLEPLTSAEAHGVVTRREEDGRFALVELDVAVEVELDPVQDDDAIRDLVAKGERDCFVGASLLVKPHYRWTVNGEAIE
jgi:uncharacterized OsmC-like protein